ncbi:MAG: DUF1573 domain-containing protein [Pontiellaceae bacterium]|nr:DUF1573 domain-containing protein [Pontiellaceae bacterium]MBN2784972.1 DUF1573 domain-containing protein [Pontiellaceae bacterium]
MYLTIFSPLITCPWQSRIRATILLALVLPLYQATGGADLVILPSQEVNLGTFPAEAAQTASFTVSNSTDRVIRLRSPESCCAMIEPVLFGNEIMPGKCIPLDVLIEPGSLTGPFRKSFALKSHHTAASPITLWISGTAEPAIFLPTSHLLAGWTEQGKPWSTNMTIKVRSDMTGKLQADTRSNIGLKTEVKGSSNSTYTLYFDAPAHQAPTNWYGTVTLSVTGTNGAASCQVQLDGCIGGSLLPQAQKLTLTKNQSSISFNLARKYPSPPPAVPAALTINNAHVQIKDAPSSQTGMSRITLVFDNIFLEQLQQEVRIPLRLQAADCTPAPIIIEYLSR